MPNDRNSAEPDVERFLESLPSPDTIRQRIARNAQENSVLKRMLKISEAARQQREAAPCQR